MKALFAEKLSWGLQWLLVNRKTKAMESIIEERQKRRETQEKTTQAREEKGKKINRGYYMTAQRYEVYFRVV